MSVLGEYPQTLINSNDLQIWNNEAFDNAGDPESLNANNLIKSSPSWSPLKKPVSFNQSSDSMDSSFSSKENRSPSGFSKSVKSPVVPLLQESKPLNDLLIKTGLCVLEKTDEEIEIENEISRLYVRLESIRLKRAKQNAKNLENQAKSKCIEPIKKRDLGVKKIDESGFSRGKIQRRGFSLGPNEIMSGTSSKPKQLGTTTPVQSIQNRRKSCFWKLEDIEEEKTGVSRGKIPSIRQAVTSIGAKKTMKKDDSVLSSIRPAKLFGEKSVPAKKPLKPGRVIPSRYNQATVTSSMKKKSLTDNVDRKSRGGTEGRVKKKWEIPSEIVIPKRLDLDGNDDEVEVEGEGEDFVDVAIPEVLPRIKAVRYVDETPRDSGPAKRVSELVGKKFYFGCVDEEEEETVCQKLSFEEDFEV